MTGLDIQEETVCRPAGRVVLRRIGKDQLLVPVSGEAARNNRVFPVNRTAAFIWERLSAGNSVADAARAMSGVFAVDYATALADCRACVEAFVEQQLLEVVPS